jgi:hypothetical protein
MECYYQKIIQSNWKIETFSLVRFSLSLSLSLSLLNETFLETVLLISLFNSLNQTIPVNIFLTKISLMPLLKNICWKLIDEELNLNQMDISILFNYT